MEPKTADTRLRYIAAYLRSGKRDRTMDTLYAAYLEEIRNTLKGMQVAKDGLDKVRSR